MTPLGAIRILGRRGLEVYTAETSDPLLRASRWFRPPPMKRGAVAAPDSRPLEDWLRDLDCERAVLMPCSDHWVSTIAALDPSLREQFPASVPTPSVLKRFVDKGEFAQLLLETGTPHPYSKVVDSRADLADVPEAVFSSAILKPRDSQNFMSHYGVKALHVSSRANAAEQLDAVVAAGFPLILQEYIPGPATNHFFVDGFVDRFGAVQAVFVRQRVRMFPLDFGNSTAMISTEVDAAAGAVASITALLSRAGYQGIFSAEFKRDPRDGIFKILEVNARAWWYVDFAARCGVDVCGMAYENALGHPVATVARYAVGQTLVFPYYDYFACAALRDRGELSLWAWFRSWFGTMQPVFQFADPVPGLRSFFEVAGPFVSRRLRRLVGSRAS
ncbi:MAG: hypothetical protein ABJF01_09415 [bacterium]